MKIVRFGAVLRQTRKQAGISQEQIAEMLHMSRSSVSKLENDKADLKAETLLKWSKAVASVKCGQAYEAAAVAVCSIDIPSVVQGLMQLLGG